MVATASTIARQELRTTDGEVYAVIIPAEELDRLRGEIDSLREQLETATRLRNHYLAKCEEYLRTLHPLMPTPEEMADPALWVGSDEIRKIISDLDPR